MSTQEKTFEELINDAFGVVEQKMIATLSEYDADFQRIADTPEGQALIVAMAAELGQTFEKATERVRDYGERIRSGNL